MTKSDQTTFIVVANVNGSEIVVVENGQKIVPIKPICDALGVSFFQQFNKLKFDPILGPTITLNVVVDADGKNREIACIPFRYVFGWLFRIEVERESQEPNESLYKYQHQCYDALYNHLTRYTEFVEYRNRLIEEQIVIVEAFNLSFQESKSKLIEAKEELSRRLKITFPEYLASKAQLSLFADQ